MILKNGLAGALALAIGWSTANAAPVLYGIDNFNDSLVSIDPATGLVTQIGSVATEGSIDAFNAMAFDEDGNLYVAVGNRFGNETDLLTLDTATGGIQSKVRTAPSVNGLAFVGSTLFGYSGASADDLITIDPATGAGTFQVSLGAPIIGGYIGVTDMSASADGTLFAVDTFTNSLLTIDPVAGASVISTNSLFGGVSSLAFDADGRLFASTTGFLASLLELDPLTGTVLSQIALGETQIRGIAFSRVQNGSTAPVPLPAAAWLFGSVAAAGLSLRKRRPKA